MRLFIGVFALCLSSLPAAAQYPQYRRPGPAQEECPQGRQIRAQKAYPTTMSDCDVLEADTAAENQKLHRGPAPNPAAQPIAPAPAVVKEDPRQHEIDEDLKLGYTSISFEDFALDTKDLIKTGKKIALLGYYRKTGNFEELFVSPMAAIQSDAMPASTRIPLLAEDAPRDLRAYYLKCSNNPGTASLGCWTRVRGYVSTCEITLLGMKGEKPCLIVEGGWTLLN
jgi:hypothetical protein